MPKTHWKKLTNPNYLGAYSLDEGQELILTIKNAQEETVIGTDGKKDNCVVCHWYENEKPMILNKTNMKTIEELYKTPYVEEWNGKKVQIYTEKVKAFGAVTDALRIRNFVPAEKKTILCECCGNPLKATTKHSIDELAKLTKESYSTVLCVKCVKNIEAEKASAGENNAQTE